MTEKRSVGDPYRRADTPEEEPRPWDWGALFRAGWPISVIAWITSIVLALAAEPCERRWVLVAFVWWPALVLLVALGCAAWFMWFPEIAKVWRHRGRVPRK